MNECCLPYFRKRRPLRFTLFEAQSLSGLLSNCLRLTTGITSSRPRLAIGGLVQPFQAGFPPAKLHNLGLVAPKVENIILKGVK